MNEGTCTYETGQAFIGKALLILRHKEQADLGLHLAKFVCSKWDNLLYEIVRREFLKCPSLARAFVPELLSNCQCISKFILAWFI